MTDRTSVWARSMAGLESYYTDMYAGLRSKGLVLSAPGEVNTR